MKKDILGSNEKNKKKELLTGNKKLIFTSIGSAVAGLAIGASISKIVPFPHPDTTDGEKDTDTPDTPVGGFGEKPTKAPQEEKPTEGKNSEGKSTKENVEGKTDKPEDLSQSEIDKIAEDLVKDSMIDERDAIEEEGTLHFTRYVPSISLPNGLESDGYIFWVLDEEKKMHCGFLTDENGDGVYDEFLYITDNGSLENRDVKLGGIKLSEFIAREHLTRSDMEQIFDGDSFNLAMTDIERRQIENDNVEVDIARLEEPSQSESSNGDVAQLSPEEEDLLLQDLMNGMDLAEVNSDEIILVDGENEIILVDGENEIILVDGENEIILVDGENEIILVDNENEIFREELAYHQTDQLSYPISSDATIDAEMPGSAMSDEISELPLDV